MHGVVAGVCNGGFRCGVSAVGLRMAIGLRPAVSAQHASSSFGPLRVPPARFLRRLRAPLSADARCSRSHLKKRLSAVHSAHQRRRRRRRWWTATLFLTDLCVCLPRGLDDVRGRDLFVTCHVTPIRCESRARSEERAAPPTVSERRVRPDLLTGTLRNSVVCLTTRQYRHDGAVNIRLSVRRARSK